MPTPRARLRTVTLRLLSASALALAGGLAGLPSAASPTKAATIPASAITPRSCSPARPFRAEDFQASWRIDDRWLPLVPGTRLALDGQARGGAGSGAHRVELIVTDLTKRIAGVRALTVWDVDRQEGLLAESELAFFAQDARGNVWNMGEYPEEYEEGKLVGAPSTWLAGRHGAIPGFGMPGAPRRGTGWYLQGSVPEIDFLDCGRVFKQHQSACVPVGCFDDLLVIDERSPLDPSGGAQRKWYARGIGNVLITAVGDPQGETLRLVERSRVSAARLATVRAQVRAMDARGRSISPVYRGSAALVQVSALEARGSVGP